MSEIFYQIVEHEATTCFSKEQAISYVVQEKPRLNLSKKPLFLRYEESFITNIMTLKPLMSL